MAISLTNGTKIPDSAIISQCYANLSMNMQVTSGLFLSQYDKSIPIVSVRLLANNNEQYIPQTGDTITQDLALLLAMVLNNLAWGGILPIIFISRLQKI